MFASLKATWYSYVLVILQPLTRIITSRRSYFTERGAPIGACIGRQVVGLVAEVQCYPTSVVVISRTKRVAVNVSFLRIYFPQA